MSVIGRIVPAPPGRRLVRLLAGLALFGFSMALLVSAELGLDPWDVLHQGLARTFGLPLGAVVIGAGVAVLLLWIPLRQRPGLGTLANALLVGVFYEVSIALLPQLAGTAARTAGLVGGIVLNALATALYIGAGLGPGPRDGLMTGLARTGRSIRRVRTAIEVTVLASGWMLGGTVGVGTALYAIAIGPLIQYFLPVVAVPEAEPPPATAPPPSTAHSTTCEEPSCPTRTTTVRTS